MARQQASPVVRQAALAAKRLGHELEFMVRIEGGKFVMRCSCGWQGRARGDGRHRIGGATRASMVGEAVEHLVLVVRVSQPETVAASS